MLTNKSNPALDPGQENAGEGEPKTPFLIKKVKCPVCSSWSEQRRFKIKLYSEKNFDLDRHIKEYGWTDSDFKKYHPPLYYFWHCPSCHFTESFLDFETPGKDTWSNFRRIKETFKTKTIEDQKIEKLVNWLGKAIDYNTMNYVQAFRLHLLAIYAQEILEDQEDWDSLKLGRYYLRLGWLFREMEENKSRELSTTKSIIAEVKKIWTTVPLNEQDALKKALEFLNIAFQKHPGIKNPVAEVDMLMWLSGIQMKLGDENKGLEYLNQVIQRGQKTIQKIDQRLKTPNISTEEETTLLSQQKKIGGHITKARDTIQDIQYQKFQKQKAEAKIIVDKMKESLPEEIREALQKAGYSSKVIEALVPEEKRKKLFGLF